MAAWLYDYMAIKLYDFMVKEGWDGTPPSQFRAQLDHCQTIPRASWALEQKGEVAAQQGWTPRPVKHPCGPGPASPPHKNGQNCGAVAGQNKGDTLQSFQ